MGKKLTTAALPGVTFSVLCDDDNVDHCPAVTKLPDGSFAVTSTLQPERVAILTAQEMDTLLGHADQIRTL
ncbi:hypothetical protein ABIA32_002667 [Streptacidiphilus sp. MAP12-20]|uniref:hypothetical protein n=1 Tax=Streptacidiphilus sp. MAP12-20 TaxID=3156299 RepID=UPI003511C51C